ncbi:MAG: hypothetical protein R3C28_28505 [Pirellulaceae bacterium]
MIRPTKQFQIRIVGGEHHDHVVPLERAISRLEPVSIATSGFPPAMP